MYNYVGDMPDDFDLVTDSQDIEATLESIGMLECYDEYGSLFVLIGDGEYDTVYGCAHPYPHMNARVELLYDSASKHAVAPGQLALYGEEG